MKPTATSTPSPTATPSRTRTPTSTRTVTATPTHTATDAQVLQAVSFSWATQNGGNVTSSYSSLPVGGVGSEYFATGSYAFGGNGDIEVIYNQSAVIRNVSGTTRTFYAYWQVSISGGNGHRSWHIYTPEYLQDWISAGGIYTHTASMTLNNNETWNLVQDGWGGSGSSTRTYWVRVAAAPINGVYTSTPTPIATSTFTPTSIPTSTATFTPTVTPTPPVTFTFVPGTPQANGTGTCWESGASWQNFDVLYKIDSSIPADWNDSIHEAAFTWNAVSPSGFDFYDSPIGGYVIDKGPLANPGWPALTTIIASEYVIFGISTRFNEIKSWDPSHPPSSTSHGVRNLMTHEFGHWLKLNDIYASGCKDATMWHAVPAGGGGETKKESLETPDINGMNYQYP